MKNKKRWMVLLAAGVLTVNGMAVTAVAEDTTENATENTTEESTEGLTVDPDEAGVTMVPAGDSDTAVFAEDGTPVSKTAKAAEMGFQVQDEYEFPYMGLNFTLPDTLKEQMDSSDVLMMTAEEWTEDMSGLEYAFLHWNKLTDEQKEEDVNLLGTGYDEWLASIERVGTLGVYSTDVTDKLDEITGCTEHKELGTSADGKFKYYLSTNKDADKDLTDEIEQIKTTLTDMTPYNNQQSAFDLPVEGANLDAENVGTFETADINGNTYTESVFSDYDLTLVNAFTTWCSPCVNEMPELEQLYQDMKDQGVGVVGMIIDAVDEEGNTDEAVLEKAKVLQEKTGVTYPLLIPDAGKLNGRIQGLQSFPESFFVDKDGNIVSDPIMGSNDLEGWKAAVEEQLKELQTNQ